MGEAEVVVRPHHHLALSADLHHRIFRLGDRGEVRVQTGGLNFLGLREAPAFVEERDLLRDLCRGHQLPHSARSTDCSGSAGPRQVEARLDLCRSPDGRGPVRRGRRQQVSPALRFRIRAWPDAVIARDSQPPPPSCRCSGPTGFAHATCAPCDPSHLWGIDRGTVGPVRAAANTFSYGTSAAEAGLGACSSFASSRRGQGSAAFWEDATVITQAVSVTAAATDGAKVLFHRPRPLTCTCRGRSPRR